MKHRLTRLTILAFLLLFLTTAASSAADKGGAIASKFAHRFLDGRHEDNLSGMTDEMKAASTREQSEPLRQALLGQSGALVKIGKPWLEDLLEKYRRFRVPVQFEKATVDFRVVLTEAGLVAGFFIVPHREAPGDTPAPPSQVREIEVTVGDGELGLPGTLSLPKGQDPFAGVVLVHGSGPNDRDETIGPNKPLRDLAWGLAQRGVAVLRYDKRSFARPESLMALGAGLTVQHEVVDDARVALALLRGRSEIDAKRVYVLGHSMGGNLAPRIAAVEPRPAGLIVLAGNTLPLPEKMVEQVRYIVNLDGRVSAKEEAEIEPIETAARSLRAALDGKTPPPEGDLLGAPFGYYRDLEAYHPAAEAASLGRPILVLQGGRDYQVTLRDFAVWKDALGGQPFACLAVYDDLDHLFHPGKGPSGPTDYELAGTVDTRVLEDIAAWVLTGGCPERSPKP